MNQARHIGKRHIE